MNIHEAIIELQKLFPKQSVSIDLSVWSHVFHGERQPELNPNWRIYVAGTGDVEFGGPIPDQSFASDGATLDTLVEMARQHAARADAPKETLDGALAAIENL